MPFGVPVLAVVVWRSLTATGKTPEIAENEKLEAFVILAYEIERHALLD